MRAFLVCIAILISLFYISAPFAQAPSALQAEEDFVYAKKLFDDSHYDLSAAAFALYFSTYPDDAHTIDALYYTAESYFKMKDYEAARIHYQRLLLEYPNSSRALPALKSIASCYEKLDNREMYVRTLMRIPLFFPTSPEIPQILLQVADFYIAEGEWNEAEIPLQQIINQYKDSPQYLPAKLGWAKLLFNRHQFEQALAEAKKIAQKEDSPEISAEAYYLESQCLQSQGRTIEAIAPMEIIIENYKQVSIRPKALSALGKFYLETHQLERAFEVLSEATATESNPEIADIARIHLVDVLFLLGEYTALFEELNQVTEQSSPEVLFRKGLILEKMQRIEEAGAVYLQCSEVDDSEFSASAIWQAAEILKTLELAKRSSDQFLKAESLFENEQEKAEVRYQAALVRFQEDDSSCVALLTDFSETYLISPRIDDMYYLRAEAEVRLGRLPSALLDFERVVEDYPFSPYAVKASLRLTLLKNHQLQASDPTNIIADLLTEYALGNTGPELALELGKVYFHDYHDYDRAVQLFQKVYDDPVANADDRLKAQYLLVDAWWERFEREQLWQQLGMPTDIVKVANETVENLTALRNQINTKDAIDKIDLRVIQAVETKLEGEPKVRYARTAWHDFLLKHETHPDNAYAMNRLACAYSQKLPEDEKVGPDQAIRYWEEVIATYPGSNESENAQLALADYYLTKGELKKAQNHYESLAQEGTGEERVQAIRRLLDMPDLPSNRKITLIRTLLRDAWYHPDTASLHFTLAELLIEEKQYQAALIELSEHRRGSSPGNPGLTILQPRDAEQLIAYARAYGGNDNPKMAMTFYRAYLEQFPEGYDAVECHRRLAAYLKKQENDDAAMHHLEALEALDVDDSIRLEAQAERCRLYFRQEEYPQARQLAKQLAIDFTNSDSAFYYSQLATVCLYRLSMPDDARQEAQQLRKDYKDRDDIDNATARFYLERGRYHSRYKEYESAQKAFETVIESFEDSPWVIEAKYELARDYLIRNMYEEGLAILTTLPDQYPNHPILGLVYVILAGYYIESGNFSDGVSTYERVLRDEQYENLWRTVYPLQIKAYRQASFYAGALKTTKEYLEKFPDAPDAFHRKMDMGQFYLALEEYDLARSQYEALKPYADIENEAACQFYIAETLEKQGRLKEAIIEYMKVDYIGKPTKLNWVITAWYNAGRCYEKLDKAEKAEEMYRRIVVQEGLGSVFGRKAQEQIDRLKAMQAGNSN
ncbi:tetratricopeptide repeat protein [bacterium]|nr:tetratricopeptide repeat protein [bacterium]